MDSQALLEGVRSKKIGAAALDVYEEEGELFYEDKSTTILDDDTLMLLIAMPNVLVTSHQAFLTREALGNIAKTTLSSIASYVKGEVMEHEICYQCDTCHKVTGQRCFLIILVRPHLVDLGEIAFAQCKGFHCLLQLCVHAISQAMEPSTCESCIQNRKEECLPSFCTSVKRSWTSFSFTFIER